MISNPVITDEEHYMVYLLTQVGFGTIMFLLRKIGSISYIKRNLSNTASKHTAIQNNLSALNLECFEKLFCTAFHVLHNKCSAMEFEYY